MGRVVDGQLDIEMLHRFPNGPVLVPWRGQARLYWDVLGLWKEVLHGLALAGRRAASLGGRVVSVGVDSWAVDFALLDADGVLLDGVHHYRSARNDGVMKRAFETHPADVLYAKTGVQFLPFNTLYQLLASKHDAPGVLARARTLLMVPDLLHFWLSGRAVCERTNASTTQFYDPRTRQWSSEVLRAFDLPEGILPDIVEPGADLGELLPVIAEATGLHGARVIAPASHDTASAVVAAPLTDENAAYISSGTWSLVGAELSRPVLSKEALEANFTNEGGVDGTTRFLKNVMGLWIVQECRRAWADVDFATLANEAEVAEGGAIVDVDDPRFLPPGDDMPERVKALCRETRQRVPETRGEIARVVFESLAATYARVLGELERVTGRTVSTVHVVGGGSLNRPLCQWTANATRKTVVAGPIDATLVGNLLLQARASGTSGAVTPREVVARTFAVHVYEPANSAVRA